MLEHRSFFKCVDPSVKEKEKKLLVLLISYPCATISGTTIYTVPLCRLEVVSFKNVVKCVFVVKLKM